MKLGFKIKGDSLNLNYEQSRNYDEKSCKYTLNGFSK